MTPNVGAIPYMAPEVMNCGSYTSKADIYSYGILLWEIITRKVPFGEETYLDEV